MARQRYIEAGRIVNTHGVNGELKLQVWLDSPAFLASFPALILDGQRRALLAAREHKGFLLVRLEGVEDLNAAMAVKGKTVAIDRRDAALPEGRFFLQDILGAQVLDEEGRTLGVLTEILERPAANVYVIRGEREHLVPAVPEFILSTDPEAGVLVVRLIEGM